jgi:hypothetical protein
MGYLRSIYFPPIRLASLTLAVSLSLIASVTAAGPSVHTTADVYWWWDTDNPVGQATLIRNDSGITAIFHTSELPAGQAVTLWFIIFNNPEFCGTDPCTAPFDIFAEGADGDFHFASGQVTGGSGNSTFAAHLRTGDNSGSGRVELGIDDGFPLMDPYKVEVLLALHSHGPAQTGRKLKHQISSFLGGCEVFLGPFGFAAGPEDVPNEVGECSTFQQSVHQPPN